MILSPYNNPPYRTPTRNSASISPPPIPSPKRKRIASAVRPATPLQVDTVKKDDDPASATACNSPRTQVAEKLQELEIQQTPQVTQSSDNTTVLPPRKRLKRNAHLRGVDDDGDLDLFSSTEPSSSPALLSRPASPMVEIGETPDWRSRLPPPPPPPPPSSSSSSSSSPAQPMANQRDVGERPTAGRSKRLRSPPPPVPEHSTPSHAFLAHISTSDGNQASPLDLETLTWQESEITGHEIDAASPDDDGEGINGIGFKPTAAIAYQRSQKRKQQVSEWKAREAREARQRRFDRRRADGHGGTRSDPSSRRMVRFGGDG